MSYYSTPELVQSEIRAATLFSSTTLPSLSTVTNWIEEESTYIDSEMSTTINGTTTATSYIDYDSQETILLRNTPVLEIISLDYAQVEIGNSSYPSYKSLTENTDYVLYPEEGRIMLLFSNFKPEAGKKRFRVIYTAGSTVVSPLIRKLCTKLVAERVLSSLIFSNVNEGNDGGSISVGSISIVEPASYGVASYKQLKTDIDTLWDSVTNGFGVYRYYG